MNHLYVDMTSNTFADELVLFGLAQVVDEIAQRTQRERPSTILRHAGNHYLLETDANLDEESIQRAARMGPYTPIRYLRTDKNASKVPADLPQLSQVHYEAERDQRAAYFEAIKALTPEARRSLVRGEQTPETARALALQPHEHWDIFRALNPAALPGYNAIVVQWWEAQGALGALLCLLIGLFRNTPNDVEGAVEAWKALAKTQGWGARPELTAQQIYNPGQGKGQNSAKANSLSMGNVSGFWLLEFLKAVGYFHAALTKNLRNSKDRKTWVLCPLELDFSLHRETFRAFRQSMTMPAPAVTADILASLRYAQVLVRHAVEKPSDYMAMLTGQRGPQRVVRGLRSAFYKNLGNAAATMNLPFIGLPGWLHIRDHADGAEALALLEEHEMIVRQFDESHSDEYCLLLSYRDWLSSDTLEPFWYFVVPFSSYIIRQRERRRYVRQFSEENIRRLIMGSNPHLRPVLDRPGFQNVAYAIRYSTVMPQYWKSPRNGQPDRRYEVRYGLGQQLARQAHDNAAFLAELSDFMFKYNAENAQIQERSRDQGNRTGRFLRRDLTTEDIDDVFELVDEYGARTICSLLVAYGYARGPRREEQDSSTPTEPESVVVPGDEDDTSSEDE